MSSAPIPKKEYEELFNELVMDFPDFEFASARNDDSLSTPEPHISTKHISPQPNVLKSIKKIQTDPNLLHYPKTPTNSHSQLDPKTPNNPYPSLDRETPHHRPVEIQSIEIIPPAPQIYSYLNSALVQPIPPNLPQLQFPNSLPVPIIIVANDNFPVRADNSSIAHALPPTIRRKKQLFSHLEHVQPIDYVSISHLIHNSYLSTNPPYIYNTVISCRISTSTTAVSTIGKTIYYNSRLSSISNCQHKISFKPSGIRFMNDSQRLFVNMW